MVFPDGGVDRIAARGPRRSGPHRRDCRSRRNDDRDSAAPADGWQSAGPAAPRMVAAAANPSADVHQTAGPALRRPHGRGRAVRGRWLARRGDARSGHRMPHPDFAGARPVCARNGPRRPGRCHRAGVATRPFMDRGPRSPALQSAAMGAHPRPAAGTSGQCDAASARRRDPRRGAKRSRPGCASCACLDHRSRSANGPTTFGR